MPTQKKRQPLISDSQRTLILGDSITYGGGYITYFETWLIQQPFGKNKEMLNLDLSSETVSGSSKKGHTGAPPPRPCLFDRRDRVLEKTKPNLVIACYGMNFCIYSPVNKERFDAYKAGMQRLKSEVEKSGAKIIFVTPPYYDDHGKFKSFNYTDTLATYSQWLVAQRAQGWDVIDLNTGITQSRARSSSVSTKLLASYPRS